MSQKMFTTLVAYHISYQLPISNNLCSCSSNLYKKSNKLRRKKVNNLNKKKVGVKLTLGACDKNVNPNRVGTNFDDFSSSSIVMTRRTANSLLNLPFRSVWSLVRIWRSKYTLSSFPTQTYMLILIAVLLFYLLIFLSCITLFVVPVRNKMHVWFGNLFLFK